MKVYTIGRDVSCNIVIDDRTDVISRRHAMLTVAPSGKMTITDLSYNGTYVNGIRISQNVPVPVTRNDNVSFAHVAQLDWNLVPNAQATYLRYAALAVLAVVLVVGGVLLFNGLNGSKPEPAAPPTVVKTDSINNDEAKKKADELAKEEQRKQDSIKAEKERKQAAAEAEKKKAKKSSTDKKDAKDKKAGGEKDKKAEEPKKPTRRH